MPDHLAFLLMATIMLIVLLLMGLTTFAFSDPHGFMKAFIPRLATVSWGRNFTYLLGCFFFGCLMAVCFAFGGIFSCLTFEMLSCPFFPNDFGF